MITAAKLAEKRILASFKGKDNNYTGLSEDQRFYFGTLGELAVVKLLHDNGVKLKYAPEWGAGADDGGIIVYADNYPCKVDVKTASKVFHEHLWIPTKQFNRYTYDGYIGVRLVDDVAEVFGYCAKKDFKKTEHPGAKVANYGIRLDELRDIEKLYEKLDAGESIIKIPKENA